MEEESSKSLERADSSKAPEERGKRTERELIAEISESFSGPLPPPQILAGFDRVVPGAAERIIVMAEKQSDHRRGLEKKVIDSDILNSRLGLVFGFIIGLVGVGGGLWVILSGKSGVGIFLSAGSLATLAGVFVYGSKQRRQERESKRQ